MGYFSTTVCIGSVLLHCNYIKCRISFISDTKSVVTGTLTKTVCLYQSAPDATITCDTIKYQYIAKLMSYMKASKNTDMVYLSLKFVEVASFNLKQLSAPLSINSHCKTCNEFIVPVMAVDNNRLNNNQLDLKFIRPKYCEVCMTTNQYLHTTICWL